MKALFVSNTSLTIRNFRLGLMQDLRSRGFEVVFCAQDNGYAREVAEKGFTFIPLTLDRKGTNFIADLKLIYIFYKIYKLERPDIILHYTIKPNIYGSIAARLASIPCITTVTCLGYVFMKKNALYYLVKALYKISCSFARRIFFQNNDDLNFFLEKKLINRKKALLVNGSGVNMGFFNPEFCRLTEKDRSIFVFLFTGRFLWDKGIGELVEAARSTRQKHPNARFWLVGIVDPGNPAGISEKILSAWQDEGLIGYWKEPADIRPFICKADCVVLPSYREGAPRSLLEALAMEKPIITTDTAGCRQVVEDGKNGFSVPVKNRQALFNAFCKMIEASPEERLAMGRSGREKVKNEFDENIVNAAYVQQIDQVVK